MSTTRDTETMPGPAEGDPAPPTIAGPSRRGPGEIWRGFFASIRPRWLSDDVLRGLRWGASAIWVILFVHECVADGVPFDREGLLLWIATGAAAFSIGKRSILAVVLDFAPFAAVLVAYDYLRGISYTLGMPTWWHPQIEVDKFLFAGHEPTVWLQEHLKHPQSDIQWYDVVVCLCYYSFFLLPYVMAGVMWLRSRADFYRWSLRFVGLSFVGFALFAIIPAAPPWAASMCTAANVADHPNDPLCLHYYPHYVHGNLLGSYSSHVHGADPWVERIAGRGFFELHLGVAHTVWTEGFNVADAVAAVPSLHLGGTMLFVLFMWSRVSTWWKPVLVAYPLVMTFSLVYSGEHYVSDCIAGALAAVIVHRVAFELEEWRKLHRRPDTLKSSTAPSSSRVPSSSRTSIQE